MTRVGPSRTYLRLLRGEITSARYVAIVRRYVQMRSIPAHRLRYGHWPKLNEQCAHVAQKESRMKKVMTIVALVGVACYLGLGLALAFDLTTLSVSGFEGLALIALAYLMVQNA